MPYQAQDAGEREPVDILALGLQGDPVGIGVERGADILAGVRIRVGSVIGVAVGVRALGDVLGVHVGRYRGVVQGEALQDGRFGRPREGGLGGHLPFGVPIAVEDSGKVEIVHVGHEVELHRVREVDARREPGVGLVDVVRGTMRDEVLGKREEIQRLDAVDPHHGLGEAEFEPAGGRPIDAVDHEILTAVEADALPHDVPDGRLVGPPLLEHEEADVRCESGRPPGEGELSRFRGLRPQHYPVIVDRAPGAAHETRLDAEGVVSVGQVAHEVLGDFERAAEAGAGAVERVAIVSRPVGDEVRRIVSLGEPHVHARGNPEPFADDRIDCDAGSRHDGVLDARRGKGRVGADVGAGMDRAVAEDGEIATRLFRVGALPALATSFRRPMAIVIV